MTEHVEYVQRFLAWTVHYDETVAGELHHFAPPEFTFEEKPNEAALLQMREIAREAFNEVITRRSQ